MSEHERIRDLLVLYAAGAVTPEEERAIATHAGGCGTCAAELRAWLGLVSELHQTPAASAPAALVERTRALMRSQLAICREPRLDPKALALANLLAWVLTFTGWAIAGVFWGVRPAVWWIGCNLLLWGTGGVAGLLLARNRGNVYEPLSR